MEAGNSRFVPPFSIALVYAGLGDSRIHLPMVGKGVRNRDVHMVFLTIDPMWDDFRSDPRFQELLQRCRFVLPRK
jgi:hypothetical protein